MMAQMGAGAGGAGAGGSGVGADDDDDSDDEDESDAAEPDAMDQDFELGPSDSDDALADEPDLDDEMVDRTWRTRATHAEPSRAAASRSLLSPEAGRAGGRGRLLLGSREGPGSSARVRALPTNDDTPTRPRTQRNIVPRLRR